MKIMLTNKFGQSRQSPFGFSFTVLFFGFFVPAFRSDWKYAALQILLLGPTLGLSKIYMAFEYNKLYIRDLLNSGYYPINEDDSKIIVAFEIVSLAEMRLYKENYLLDCQRYDSMLLNNEKN